MYRQSTFVQVRRLLLLCCDCRDRYFEIKDYTCTGQWIRRRCRFFKRSKHCCEAPTVSLRWLDWLGCRLNASCTSIFEISRREGPILMPVNQKTMPAVQTVQTLTRSSTINSQKVLDLFFLDMRFWIREMVFWKWFRSFRPGVNQLWFEIFMATLGSFMPVRSVWVDRCD